jgi:hypothetical protein
MECLTDTRQKEDAMLSLDELQPAIVARSWEDPRFRARLLHDPHGALTELGPDYAAAIEGIRYIRVHEESEDTLHLVLPMSPIPDSQLSDSFLDSIAMSDKGETMKGPNCATKDWSRPCSRECR